MNNLTDTYLFKALDAYPYDLPEAIESLNYALSYDDKNPIALRLMGQIYGEQLCDYETAKHYFEEALAEDIYCLSIYKPYINVLTWNDDFEKALKLIEFALTVKGIDKGMMYFKRAIIYEHLEQYKEALKALRKAKNIAVNSAFIEGTDTDKKRIKDKMPKKKKKAKAKKKDKKKKSKKKKK